MLAFRLTVDLWLRIGRMLRGSLQARCGRLFARRHLAGACRVYRGDPLVRMQGAVEALREGKPAKAGFADVLISRIALGEGCCVVVSFDRAAIRAAGMTAVE